MVQVPLPQEAPQGGSPGAFRAFSTVPLRSATGGQIQRLGRATTIAGTATANIADVLQDDLDTARTKEAYALWNDENRLALHGANPADLGYLNKKGKAATGDARINTQNRIAKNAGTFSKGLDNEDQRAMFEQAVQARTSQINQQLDVHEAQAIRVFGIGEAKALSEEAAGDAVDARTLPIPDLDTFNVQKMLSVQEAEKVGEMLGYGPEQTEALVLDTTTAIHLGVIDRFIAEGNPDLAQLYLQGVDKNEISAEARTKLAGVMQSATMNDRATDLSNVILGEVDALSTEIIAAQRAGTFAAGDRPIRLDADDRLVEARRNLAARDMPDSLRQATRQRLETAYSDRAAAEATVLVDVITRSQEFLKENPRMGPTDLPDADQAELVRTGRWAGMNRFADTGRFGSDPQAFATFLGLGREELLAIKSGEQLELDMADLGMNRNDRNIIRSEWARARQEPDAPPDRALLLQDRMKATARRHTLMPKKGVMSPANALIYDGLRDIINKRIAEEEASPRGRPFGDDLQKIIDKAFREELVTVDPGLFTFEVFALRDQLSQEQLFGTGGLQPVGTGIGSRFEGSNPAFRDFILRDLTGTEVQLTVPVNDLIVSRLRAKGIPVTNERIFEAWVDLGKPETLAEADNR